MDTFTRELLANEAEEEASLQSYLIDKQEEEYLSAECGEDGMFCEDTQTFKTWEEIDYDLFITDMMYDRYLMDLEEYNERRMEVHDEHMEGHPR